MRGLIATRNPLATSVIAKHRQGFIALRDKLSSTNIALLQTCRQAYVEGIYILYAKNSFDFAHPETARAFLLSLLPARLQLIRGLSVSFESSASMTDEMASGGPAWWDIVMYWEPLWRIVREKLPSLRRVQIFVCIPGLHQEEKQTILMRPLEHLNGLDEFKIDLRVPKLKSSGGEMVELCEQVCIWRALAMKGRSSRHTNELITKQS